MKTIKHNKTKKICKNCIHMVTHKSTTNIERDYFCFKDLGIEAKHINTVDLIKRKISKNSTCDKWEAK